MLSTEQLALQPLPPSGQNRVREEPCQHCKSAEQTRQRAYGICSIDSRVETYLTHILMSSTGAKSGEVTPKQPPRKCTYQNSSGPKVQCVGCACSWEHWKWVHSHGAHGAHALRWLTVHERRSLWHPLI